jgi:hypothetical protein
VQTEQEYIVLSYPGDRVVILGFLTKARGNVLPFGASWLPEHPGWWYRPATDANIREELSRTTETLRRSHGLGRPDSWKLVDKADLPAFEAGERRYRDAWRYDGTTFSFDASTLQELHRNVLRVDRAARLDDLDTAWMVATREGDAAAIAEINAEKQVLLDAPAAPEIVSASTPEELKPITLDALLEAAVTTGVITQARTLRG